MDALPKCSPILKSDDCANKSEVGSSSLCFNGRNIKCSQPSLVTSHFNASNDQCHNDSISGMQVSIVADGIEEPIDNWDDLDPDDLPAFAPKIESEPEPEKDGFFSCEVKSNQYQKNHPLVLPNYLGDQTYGNKQIVGQINETHATCSSAILETDLPDPCLAAESKILNARTSHEEKLADTFLNGLKNIAHVRSPKDWRCRDALVALRSTELTDSEKNKFFLYSDAWVNACQDWLPAHLITVIHQLTRHNIITLKEDEPKAIEDAKIRLTCALLGAINNKLTDINANDISYLIWVVSRLSDTNNKEMRDACNVMLNASLSSINRESENFNIHGYFYVLWGIGGLLKKGMKNTSELNKTLNILFQLISKHEELLSPNKISGLIGALSDMLTSGSEKSEQLCIFIDKLIKLTPAIIRDLKINDIALVTTAITKFVECKAVDINNNNFILAMTKLINVLTGKEARLRDDRLANIILGHEKLIELGVTPSLAIKLHNSLKLALHTSDLNNKKH